ncbi:MAG: L7Ae/L30e/S12e/Gadd45 family ribosomal protein [Desulfurispora sp.]|uniref:L7Ae/L30e/S12e/Gadd45 family ribosomal protein n=1 Tax=Desulfurispora sp. TaxID=3014275 RepID=UPI004048F50C
MSSNLHGLLGLARRAGQLVSGDACVRQALERKQVRLLVLATDAAPRTKKIYRQLASKAQVPLLELAVREELGALLGMTPRAVVAIKSDSLAGRLLECYRAEKSDQPDGD